MKKDERIGRVWDKEEEIEEGEKEKEWKWGWTFLSISPYMV